MHTNYKKKWGCVMTQWIKKITTPINGYQICPYARKAKYKIYTHLDTYHLDKVLKKFHPRK